MLTPTMTRPTHRIKKKTRGQQPPSEISRLLSAAVINRGFRELLLSDPARALSQGYLGETFSLDYGQEALILSIRAENLSDFALQITTNPVKEAPCGSAQWIPVNQPAFALHAK